ncbi:MAG: outer membrane lipoprotein LolB [Betaproteobacteria bacterium]
MAHSPAAACRRRRSVVVARAFAMLVAAWLSACASVAPPATSIEVPLVAVDRFDIAGRLSVQRGAEGVSGNFTWRHQPDGDWIDLASPTGQTLARMSGDKQGVRVERPGEAPLAAVNWDVLTRDVFGVPIPVQGLAAWVVGAPRSGQAFGLERDALGRPSVLRQSGWEIVYAYVDGAPATRPRRLVMRYPDPETIDVRVVVDRWNESAAP